MLTLLLLKWMQWMRNRGSYKMIRRQRGDRSSEDYLERFYLLRVPGLDWGVFLHRFWASDQEGVHCHPWHNASLVLCGGYFESGVDGVARWRGAGALCWRHAEVMHRVQVPEHLRGETWTLFWHGRRRRRWGFLGREGWEDAGTNADSRTMRGLVFPRFV